MKKWDELTGNLGDIKEHYNSLYCLIEVMRNQLNEGSIIQLSKGKEDCLVIHEERPLAWCNLDISGVGLVVKIKK